MGKRIYIPNWEEEGQPAESGIREGLRDWGAGNRRTLKTSRLGPAMIAAVACGRCMWGLRFGECGGWWSDDGEEWWIKLIGLSIRCDCHHMSTAPHLLNTLQLDITVLRRHCNTSYFSLTQQLKKTIPQAYTTMAFNIHPTALRIALHQTSAQTVTRRLDRPGHP
jgi:hypothetical protein